MLGMELRRLEMMPQYIMVLGQPYVDYLLDFKSMQEKNLADSM